MELLYCDHVTTSTEKSGVKSGVRDHTSLYNHQKKAFK